VIYAADPQHPWRLGRYYIKDTKTGRLAEAVVALSQRGLKADDPQRPAATITVDQKNFQFIPETSAIRAGDHVRFINSDDHTHNVKTSHPKFSFNVTMPVDGEQTETFQFAGGINQPYRIDCVLHSAMRAWIYVFDHPWFHVTTSEGDFEWKDVPAGEYRLGVVHPAGDLRHRQTIQVLAGQTLELAIVLHPQTAPR
jgi:plastocyanin